MIGPGELTDDRRADGADSSPPGDAGEKESERASEAGTSIEVGGRGSGALRLTQSLWTCERERREEMGVFATADQGS